ncbi:putative Maf protein [Danaus plexippus plexippus]|uniref:Maf protein n=1 Tax=Danaus plexippus plexippus TaxID=278856 RepID=A0A212EGZ9_DANPL|nr:putative Maf protein [Danaus plexippus plexippus]
MLQPVMHLLKHKNIILASGSPRRKELIENIGLKVALCPSLFEENLDPKAFDNFSDFVEETALHKVLEVEKRLKENGNNPDVVIGADTMVTLDGKMFGKPTSEQEAYDMLKSLSGRSHTVYTGVVVKALDDVVKFTEKTDVVFGALDDEQIKGYIATGEPMDKAGGYGIQGVGGTFVEKINGDYFTVVGLPLYRLCSVLYELFKENKEILTVNATT